MGPVVRGPLGPGHQLFPGSEGEDEPGIGADLEHPRDGALGTKMLVSPHFGV